MYGRNAQKVTKHRWEEWKNAQEGNEETLRGGTEKQGGRINSQFSCMDRHVYVEVVLSYKKKHSFKNLHIFPHTPRHLALMKKNSKIFF